MKFQCIHCGFRCAFDEPTCPACNQDVTAETPNENAIYDRVFSLKDENESLRDSLASSRRQVIEEAARVAEEKQEAEADHWNGHHTHGYEVAKSIAAAIRALATGEGER